MLKPIFFAIAGICAIAAANAQNPSDQCFESIQRNPAMLPVVGKVAFTPSELKDFKYLVNTDRVSTDEERTAIGAFVEERQKCERLNLIPNLDLAAVRRTQVSAIESAAADLYMGLISYGEFAKQRARAGDDADRAWRQIQGSLQAQYEAQENARRQAILGMMMNRPAYQPAPLTFTPMQVPKATTSNCTWIGNQLNCTTR
jgi:hypothetical protein